MEKSWKERFRGVGLTAERVGILAGVSAARLSQISRGLVQPTEVEVERIETVLRKNRDSLAVAIKELTGLNISALGSLSKAELIIISLLSRIAMSLETRSDGETQKG